MEEIFSYKINKEGKVFLLWHGKQVKALKGREGRIFITRMSGLDQRGGQLLIAKVTGNFKRGNEREAKK